jgi:hypothetical protein
MAGELQRILLLLQANQLSGFKKSHGLSDCNEILIENFRKYNCLHQAFWANEHQWLDLANIRVVAEDSGKACLADFVQLF